MSQATNTTKTSFVLRVDFKPIVFVYVLDLLARVLLCVFYFLNHLGPWVFVGSLAGITLVEVYLYTKVSNRYIDRIRKKIGSKKLGGFDFVEIEFAIRDALMRVYVVMGLIVSFWFFFKVINPEHWYTYFWIFILGLIGASLYMIPGLYTLFPRYFGPVKFSVMKKVTSKTGKSDAEEITTTDVSHQFSAELNAIEKVFDQNIVIDEMDVNDAAIARIESELKNVNTKVESYMLESVLIGSLTFSGFLTIIASGITADLPGLFSGDWGALSLKHPEVFFNQLDALITTRFLFSLVLVESLFCSVFFILVLALRLGFAQLSLKLDYLIRIMTIFNAKEEELINMELSGISRTNQFEQRKRTISHKIGEAINDANKLVKDIKPLAQLMTVYRNIGLLIFFIILITSGFFFSSRVGLIVLSIALLTFLFRVFDSWRSFQKIQRLVQRH